MDELHMKGSNTEDASLDKEAKGDLNRRQRKESGKANTVDSKKKKKNKKKSFYFS
jgi:hypothetical protein